MTQPRVRRLSRLSRVAACLLTGMAVATVVGLVSEPSAAGYARVLVASVVVLSAAAAVKMWCHNCFESQLVAVVLALLTVTGQVLAVTLGGPGAGSAHWHAAALGVVVLGAAVPVLVGFDAHLASRAGTLDPPYAL